MPTTRPLRSAWKSMWKKSVARRAATSRPSAAEPLECRILPAAVAIVADVDGYARDANRDNVFTVLDTAGTNLLSRSSTGTNVGFERTLFEFDLSTISTALTVDTATLVVNVSQFTKSGITFPKINVVGYTGNGFLELTDASVVGTQVATIDITAKGELRITLDAEFVRSQGGGFLGLRIENPVINGPFGILSSLESGFPAPTLELDLSLNVEDKEFNIDEQRPNGTIVGEIGIGNNAVYTVLGGDPGGVFALNPLTGRITVADSTQLKFAIQPQYVLNVQATLPDGTIGTFDVTINVKNVFGGNNPPVVTASEFTIEEFSPVNTVVGAVDAVDPDSADPLEYAITGGNTNSAFKINSLTGVITVNNQNALNLRSQTSFVLQVSVRDTRLPRNTVVQNITVLLTPRGTSAVAPNAVNIVAGVDGEARDANSDGIFETIDTTADVMQIQKSAIGRRAVMEFDLSTVSSTKIVKSAFLTIYVNANTGNVIPINVFGYSGDGVASASDAQLGALIGSRTFTINSAGDLKAYTIELDRALVQQLLGTTNDLGLVLRNDLNANTITIDSSEGPGNLGNSLARQPSLNLVLEDAADDVVFVNTTNQALTVARSNGTAFTTLNASALRQGVTFSELLTGDFNGDGRMDIAGRNAANGQVLVAIASANQFVTGAAWTTYSMETTFSNLVVGDFNGDGKDDIVGRSAQGHLVVAQSAGNKFNNIVYDQLPASLRNLTDVRVGDFNGDGKDDLAGRVSATGQLVVSISNGSSFTSTVWGAVAVAGFTSEVNVGDFNGDGRDDLVVKMGTAASSSLVVVESTGTSFVNRLFSAVPVGVPYIGFRVGDFNGDGRDDVIGYTGTGAMTVFRSTGSKFTLVGGGSLPPGTAFGDVVIGDFNRDGKSDILTRQTVNTIVGQTVITTQQLFVSAGTTGGLFSSTLFGSIANAGPFTLLGVGNF